MNRRSGPLAIMLAAALMLAPSSLRATSAVPEPGAIGIPINPTASGTKISGPVSIFFDLVEQAPTGDCAAGVFAQNMSVIMTLDRGNNTKPFARDFFDRSGSTPTRVVSPVCFSDTGAQATFVFGLIVQEVIPFFFSCGGTTGVTCPGFQVKSASGILSSGTGAVSFDIELAVK